MAPAAAVVIVAAPCVGFTLNNASDYIGPLTLTLITLDMSNKVDIARFRLQNTTIFHLTDIYI